MASSDLVYSEGAFVPTVDGLLEEIPVTNGPDGDTRDMALPAHQRSLSTIQDTGSISQDATSSTRALNWNQNDTEVEVTVTVPEHTSSRDLNC